MPSDFLWFAPSVYLIGTLLDNISTYILAKVHGLEEFYESESNHTIRELTERHGLEKGFIYSFFNPEQVLAEVIFIVIFALFTLYISFMGDMFYSPITYILVGVLSVGLIKLVVAISNTIFCFNPKL